MEELLTSRQSRRFDFVSVSIKLLFPICTLAWRVDNYVSRQGEGMTRRDENKNYEKIVIIL